MTLFCDGLQCQTRLCALCVVANHKTHNVIPYNEKAENVIAELERMRENSEKLKCNYMTYLMEVNKTIKEINVAKDKSLQCVDDTKDMIINSVTEIANNYKRKIMQNNDKQLDQLKSSIDDVTGRVESLETCCSLIGQFISGNSPQEILANSEPIIQGCKEATKFTELTLPSMVKVVSFTPKRDVDFVQDVFGELQKTIKELPKIKELHDTKAKPDALDELKVHTDANAVTCVSDIDAGAYEENLEAVLGACAEPFIENDESENQEDKGDIVWERKNAETSTKAAISKEAKAETQRVHPLETFSDRSSSATPDFVSAVPKEISVQGKPTVAKHTGSWQGNGIHICVGSNSSMCISGKDGDMNKVKAFDMEGNGKLILSMDVGIHAPFSISIGNRDYLIITTEKELQLRDGITGKYLDHLDFAGFEPGWTICQSGSDTILVSNWSHTVSTLNEYQIKDGKIKPPRKQIKIPLSIIRGLTMVTSGDRNLIVATSLHESAVLAINYETGQEVWKIKQENFEGARIGPFGITSDGTGHMFVSDCTNKRILVVSPSGKILQRIVGNATGCLHLVFIHGKRKLAVTDVNHMVHLYDIQYEIA